MNYISTVREYIVENFLFGEGENLNDTDSFFETGIVDSTGILELVSFLEETFRISISDEELVPEHFTSLSTIEKYLSDKLNGNVN